MVARLGDDLFGRATLDNFASFGIDAAHVLITPGVSSGVAPIFVDAAGQNRILVVKGANDRLSPADIEAAADVLMSAAFIILQLEIPLETVYCTLRFAKRHNIRTILNPAPGQSLDPNEIANADYLIPNETEAEALTGVTVRNLDDARACAGNLLDRGVRRVIVTLGAKGALCVGADGVQHIAPFVVPAVDTTGAGDAFIGSLAYFLARGFEEFQAISRANLYAALSTLAIGTQKSFPTLERFEVEWGARSPELPGPAR